MGIFLVRHMPVIEKIIMEQRTSDQFPAIAADVQLFADGKTVSGYIPHMVIDSNITMLNMLLRRMKIFRV